MDGEQSSQVFWHNLASSCCDYLLTDCFWIGQLDCESEVSIFNFTKAQILCLDFSLNGKLINTSYLTDSYIVFTLKMESVSKNTIFGLKRMVKSGLEKIFLKFLHAGDYFPLLHKSAQSHKFSNKSNYLSAWRDSKMNFSRALFTIIFRPNMVFLVTDSILRVKTMYESVK
jgi:hypothetical protein